MSVNQQTILSSKKIKVGIKQSIVILKNEFIYNYRDNKAPAMKTLEVLRQMKSLFKVIVEGPKRIPESY